MILANVARGRAEAAGKPARYATVEKPHHCATVQQLRRCAKAKKPHRYAMMEKSRRKRVGAQFLRQTDSTRKFTLFPVMETP